jgi:hypothetical protein
MRSAAPQALTHHALCKALKRSNKFIFLLETISPSEQLCLLSSPSSMLGFVRKAAEESTASPLR